MVVDRRDRRFAAPSRRARRSRRRRRGGGREARGWRRRTPPPASRRRSRSRRGRARGAAPWRAAGSWADWRVDDHLAGEDGLLELAGADPLAGRGDGRLVVLRGTRAIESPPRRSGCGSSSGSPVPASDRARVSARRSVASSSVSGPSNCRQCQQAALARSDDRELRQDRECGWERAPLRRRAPVAGEGEAADPDRARAAGEGRRARRRAGRVRPGARAADVLEPGLLPRDRLVGAAEPRQREARVGLLPAEPAIGGEPRGEDRGGGIEGALGQLGRRADRRRLPSPPVRSASARSRSTASVAARVACGWWATPPE